MRWAWAWEKVSSVPRCKWDGKKHLNPGCHTAYTATIPKIFASLYSRFCHWQETECSNCRAASKLSPTHLELLNLQACQAKPKFRPERKHCLFCKIWIHCGYVAGSCCYIIFLGWTALIFIITAVPMSNWARKKLRNQSFYPVKKRGRDQSHRTPEIARNDICQDNPNPSLGNTDSILIILIHCSSCANFESHQPYLIAETWCQRSHLQIALKGWRICRTEHS